MNELISYFIDSLAASGIFYVFYVFVIEKQNAFRYSRFYLLSTSILSLVFPLVKINSFTSLFSVQSITNGFQVYMDEVIISNPLHENVEQAITLSEIFFWIYLAGALLTAMLFIIKLTGLLRFIHNNEVQRSGKYSLLFGNNEILSFSFFNYIFIGKARELSEPDRDRIIEHEMTHVNQRHSFDSIYFEFLTILFWFNPFIWLYKKMMVDLHEYLADEAVIKKSSMEEYSRLLIHQVIGFSDLRPASHFENSKTLKRINKMKTYKKRYNKFILALYFPILVLVFISISCNDNNQNITQKASGSGNQESSVAIDQNTTGRVETQEKDSVYNIVDEQPAPLGGMTEFYKYIQMNLKYPESARQKGIEGKVFVSFKVDKIGKISEVQVLKGGIDPDCNNAAIQVLAGAENWIPGKVKGQPVSVRMIMPIVFKLSEK